MRIGTGIDAGNGFQYLTSGLEAIKFSYHGQIGIFLRIKIKCSACDHLQEHDSRGYLLGDIRPLQKAAQDILCELLNERAGRIDCDFCGQNSLIVPQIQRNHVQEWILAHITEEWFEKSYILHEPQIQIMGTCIN